MKQSITKKISLGAATALAVFALVGVGTSYAADNEVSGREFGRSEERAPGEQGVRGKRGGPHHHFLQDLTEEERESIRETMQGLSEDERAELRAEHQAAREENREAFEDFTGFSKEEAKEIRQSGESLGDAIVDSGRSESEIKDFLEEQAEDKVDNFVNRFDVSNETESNMRAKISDFVEKMFERLFKTKTS